MAFLAILTLFISFNSYSAGNESNVILLMLDGVRWQEVFHGTDPELDEGDSEQVIFKNLFQDLGANDFLTGDKTMGNEMSVSNDVYISLPAYQSIMAGYTQSCLSNSCGRISVETVGERILREMNLSKYQVATISSWNKIPHSVEHIEGKTFVNAGQTPLLDETNDPETAEINRRQMADAPPWHDARLDKYTFAHAMNYLKKHQPRFLFISLNDSDEWGHKGHYKNYVSSLRQYDEWIASLIKTLQQMGEYGKSTTLLITTDHGRGDGKNWKHHSALYPASEFIWLYGRNPLLKGHQGVLPQNYTHIDIRPTIEATLGLSPIECKKCGKVIQELVPSLNQ